MPSPRFAFACCFHFLLLKMSGWNEWKQRELEKQEQRLYDEFKARERYEDREEREWWFRRTMAKRKLLKEQQALEAEMQKMKEEQEEREKNSK